MLKKLILVQIILLSFQTVLYFGCEVFQRSIHDVERPVDDKIPFLPWTVLPYSFWFPRNICFLHMYGNESLDSDIYNFNCCYDCAVNAYNKTAHIN